MRVSGDKKETLPIKNEAESSHCSGGRITPLRSVILNLGA